MGNVLDGVLESRTYSSRSYAPLPAWLDNGKRTNVNIKKITTNCRRNIFLINDLKFAYTLHALSFKTVQMILLRPTITDSGKIKKNGGTGSLCNHFHVTG